MRCAHLAVLLLAVVGSAQRARAEAISAKGAEALLLAFVKDLQSTIGNDGGNSKRRLLTVTDSVQAFFESTLGGGWRDLVPERWANASAFDWGKLGEFDYGSNLGDFLDARAAANLSLADIKSVHDVAASMQQVEAAFCDQESYTASKKVPAKCTGPSVTIALAPKVCVLEAKTKQILCDPAKLVLTKTPVSCTHKYKSASSWTGKECKITGGAGFSDEKVIGGGERSVPLIEFSVDYQY